MTGPSPPDDADLEPSGPLAELLAAAERPGGPGGHVAARVTLPAEEADTVPADDVLDPSLAAGLDHDLYNHQAAALDALDRGEHVVLSTSTDSGKTLAYGLAIARRFREDPATRALLVYPTKALSRDQADQLRELFATLGLDAIVGVYDGDTAGDEKREIRDDATAILTNPAGLNQYLADHHLWADVHANCALVVIDEAHSWTGLSGMHVAWICRRARRVTGFYGGDPQYVLASATIGNPAEHARALTGEPATVIDADGSPSGRTELVFWEPPVDDGPGGTRGDGPAADLAPDARLPASVTAPRLWASCADRDVQTLLFCDSRLGTELAADRGERFLGRLSGGGNRDVTDTALASYNAGHGRDARRETERRLGSGDLDGVATTSALEVGIDVGGMDATVLQGYPGTRQSFWQRVGRAGRNGTDALGVFVPRVATLDRYLAEHPEYLREHDPEDAVVDLSNDAVYLQHVAAAADELPLTADDAGDAGGAVDDGPLGDAARLERAVEYGRRTGTLEGDLTGGVRYAHRDRPQDEVSLYAAGGDTFDVRLAGDGEIAHEPIGRARAYRDYHEGATVLFRGERYVVTALREDRPQPVVELARTDADYYTQSRRRVDVSDTTVEDARSAGALELRRGTGTVRVRYPTYRKRDVESGRVRESGLETGLGPLELDTELVWAVVPDELERSLLAAHGDYANPECTAVPQALQGYLGGLHAVEHAMIAATPLELTIDDADLGGLATNRLPGDPEHGGWFVYDGVDGGLGFARRLYEEYESVAARARQLVADCPCDRPDGCPACLMDDRCGNDNRPLYGPAALDVLDAIGDATDAATIAGRAGDGAATDPTGDLRRPASIS